MKIIDLLNKIANSEDVPKKFKIKGSCFKDLYFEYDEEYNCYDLIGEKFKNGCYVFGYSELNDEIEIIEDTPKEEKKIPKKLSTWFSVETKQSKELNIEYANTNFENMYEKINEIIDCLDYLKSKGK